MSLFDELDLGAEDYSQEKPSGISQFTSKPSPRPYQPFGGQIQQAPQTYAAPQYYEQPQTPEPQSYNVFSDDELDTYERAKKDYSYINQYSSAASQIANKRKSAYDDFKKNKLLPFFEQSGGFGEFDDDDELAAAIDEMEAGALKTSQMEDGWLGPSDEKIAAGESLNNFKLWSSPNGLRDQYRRLRSERDQYQGIADSYKNQKMQRLEQLTNIPIPAREALDEALKSRGKSPGSKKKMNELLNGMSWEQPVVGYDGEVQNLEKVDPRAKINPAIGYDGQGNQSSKAQRERVAAAMRGDVRGVLSRRKHIARERQLRDKGFFFSESGLLDGRPIGLSRRDVDLLDIDDMRKAGMTSYQGRPLDEAMAELGGEERLEMAKVMQSVYASKSNYEDAQLAFLKVAGGSGAEKAREKMEAARDDMQKTVGLAAGYGLDNELFEQAETTGWLGGLGNAIKRGMLMSEMSNYTDDFLTNTLDADEMQRFIEIASEMEKLPTSSTMKRVKETKSDGFLDAMGNLLFDNPAAIPEMFVESLSSFLPATIKSMIATVPAGAAAGAAMGGLPGAKIGAAYGARASWGVASFVLEASGMALEGMQELNIDWKNPKVFAAAWTNESIRSKIQKKMVQKGVPIAIADTLTGMMAGKVMGVVNHTGNAVFKGGKLLNKEAFNKAAGSVPRFTLMQKTRNAAVELGADSTMGMGGEYLGQWASKEPGEDWDWDAIAAEGLIGVGPGALGAALEMRGPRANYFGNAPIEIAGEQQTETGTTGTVTRAGYSAPYQTFNDAESMMGHLASFPGVNPETLEFTQKWVDTMYRIRPEQMSKLKIAVSPRTPDANLKNRGTFESRDGHDIMYLNEQEFAADPLGTFMHESGHFARIMILNDEQLMKIWNDLGEPAQKDAYTQYFTKVPEATFDSLSDSEKKKVERAFKRTDNDILAEEWFSYQWARVLTGYKVDKNIANPLKNFKNKVIHPLLGPYIGSESVAGSTGDKGYVIDQQILDFLGYENGMPDPKTPDSTDAPASSVPESKEAMEAKLKAAPGKPADKVKIAKTLNAMAGEKILSTDPSFYTRMERGSVAALGADSEERNKKEQSELEKVEAERLGKSELSNEDKKNLSETKREEYFETKADKKEALRKKLPIANSKKASEKVRTEARAEADKIKSDLDKLDDRVDQEISAEMRDAEIKSLDRLIPATKAEITRLFEAVVETKNKFKSVDNLNIEINRAIRNLGPDASTGQIIAEVLNLKKLLELAPASFISEFEKRVNPSQKNNRSNEIGDMAAEAHEKIDDYKEALRNRILEIDKQIDSLQKELDKNPPAQDDAPAAFEFNKTQKRKGYLNNAVKLNYTGKPILAYPAFINEKLADYNFALKKADKVGSEGSGWVVIEVSSGKILNGNKLQRDTRDDAIKAVRDFIDSDEKVGVIQGVGKKTKGRPEEVSDGNRIDSEIEELQEKKVLANRFLQLVAPEEIAIDWKDLPVANHFYRDGLKFAPITLGMLADNSKKISYQIFLKTDKGYKKASAESRTGQEFLWDFLKKFNPKTAPNEAGALGYYGKYSLKPKDYVMALEAVKASAMFPKQKAIGLKPKGQARYEKIDGQNVESSKGYPAGYQSEKGGTLAAIIAERLTKSKKLRVGTPALSLNPTVEEILALKAANGRSLELLGDPSDSERDFNNLIASLLGYGDIKDGEGEYAEIEDYARTANEQISNGTPVVEALLNIPSIVQRKKFEAESREADSKSAMSENSDIKPRGNEIFITSGFAVPPQRDYNAVRVLDSKRGAEKVEENYIHEEFTRGKIFETFDVISSYVKGRTEEELKSAGLGWVKKGPKFDKNRTNIQKSEEMPDRPLLDTGEKADIKSTTDVSAADFAKWYLSEGPDAKKNKSQRKNRRGEKDQRDLTRTQKRLRDLQALPSSKDGKQLPGGLGEGLLPYVFVDFARAMFTKLNLKYSFDTLLKDARDLTKKSDFKWNYERGTMLVDGKPSDEFKPFIKEEERLTPEGMDILAQPIVQAVIDAEGVDIYNQLESSDEAMLQRDTGRGEQQEDNSAEMGDDSGETEQSFTEDPKAVALEQRQKDLVEALEAKPDALKDKSKVSDELLEEVYYSGTSPEIVEAAREELDRRGVKGIRTLNSDTGRVYHGTRTNLLGSLINSAGDLVFKPSSNFGGKVTGVSFSNDQNTAEDYRTRSKTRGTKGRDLSQGWLIDIDPSALQEATYPLAPTDEIDNELFFRTNEDIVIPQGSWGATKDGIRVTSKEGLDRINSKSAKAADAKMRGKSTEALVKVIVDTDNTSALNEYYQYDESTDYTDSDAAARELRMRGISKDKLTKLFNKFSQAEAINPSDYADSVLAPKTLNSDAKTLTSDADPNLSKLSLLARIAGGKDGERAEEFQKWMDAKKQSIKTGSFKMNFVDRADPLKQFHRGIVNVLKKVGIDENHPLYEQLNVHGRLHQYFGSGYETVEQAELNFINPIKDLLREHNINLKTFGEYLLARAAPSRNLQIKARADELLADIKKEEKEGEASAKYKAERAKYYDKDDNFLLSSGIDEATAIKVVKKLEANSNFKKFAEKALPIYYRMNLSTLDTLSQSDMIQEPGEKGEGKPLEGFKEKTAMIKAASRFPWAKHSSIKLPDDMGNYSYAPMQGFEGETQNYLDGEAAWEEFGAAGTGGSGKGFDQPKSRGILGGAFGRSGAVGPDPNTVFAVSVNQYFNNNILAAKNEVAKSFGSMFEAIRELTHPQKESDKNDPESTRQTANPEFQGRFLSKEAEGLFKDLSKLDEGMVKELKDEFDKIFEPDYKMVEGKKLYEYPDNGNKLVMTEKQLSTVYKNDPLTFVYRRDGEARLIKFKGTPEGLRMADTMKNLRYESLPSILQFFNKGTRFMARMFTSMNPAFIIPNFFRDLGTAAIHLTEDGKKKMFKDAVNMKNIGSFAKAIFKTEQMIANGDNPNKNPEVQKLLDLPVEELAKSTHPMAGIARYQKAKQSGAKIGYFRHESVPELIRGIQKDLKKSKKGLSKKGLAKLGSFVDSSNTAIENSIRMSTFWAAIKNGYNQDQAAVIARNVTVDFNQKGNLTQALGSLYVFFGASMNSMHRFVTSWNRRSTEDKIKMFGGIAAASMTIALFNRLVDDDEDEEMPDYDTISSYKRDTNFILPLPAGLPEFFNDEKDTGYFSIPLPLGYNVFWTLGQVAADMFAKNVLGRGGEGFVGGSTRIMDSAMNAFNPIGGATIATIGTPSLVTPLVELYANKNFMGRPIRYDDQPFEVPKPAYMQDPKSTPKHWNDLSKAINSFMGGSETVKGSVKGMFGGNPLMYSSDEDIQFDLSGNEMRHAILGYLGGPGQIADSMLGAMITGAQGESSIRNINDIPMINRFLRATTYGSQTRDTFYGLRDAIKTAEKAVKTAKEISPQAYASVLKDNKSLLQLSSQISALDKQKNKLRRLKNKIEGSKALSEEQKTQRVDEIQKKELNLMVAVIKKAQSLGIS